MPAQRRSKSLLNMKTRKVKRVSAAVEEQVNEKFWGADPPPVSDRARFLTWCAYMVDDKQAREWMEAWCSTRGLSVKRVPDKWLNRSACFRARLKTLGAPFTETQDQALHVAVEGMLAHVTEDEEKPAGAVVTIADRVREKFSDVMGELEGLIDDGIDREKFDFEAWLREKTVSVRVASMMKDKLGLVLGELMVVQDVRAISNVSEVTEEGKQLLEGYARFRNFEVQAIVDDYTFLYDVLDRMIDNEKRARAPRKAKPVSAEKKLKHLVHQQYSKEYNLRSFEPSKLLGAAEVWTFNSKYKLVTVYRAESHGGKLGVERSRVSGFDRNNSFTYRLGRGQKSAALLDELSKSTRAAAKRVVSGLKEAPLAERVNENTILLKVY